MTFNPHPAAHENHELELRIMTVSDYEGTVFQGKVEFNWDAFFTNEFEVQHIVCVTCDYQHLDRSRTEIV